MNTRSNQSATRSAYLAVGLGGALGATIRQLIVETLATQDRWHSDILLINVFGSGMLALVLILGERTFTPRTSLHHLWRPFMATGVLGGFTTTSAYAVIVAQAMSAGISDVFWAVGVGSVVAGLAAYFLIYEIASRVIRNAV